VLNLGIIKGEINMATLSKKNFSNPDEKLTPEKTDMRIVDLAGTKMARIEVQPGWKWEGNYKDGVLIPYF
jgi:hypothetical protein|tara:strand:+ start:160 stop:369 length:210 start_codon:yes stop_codon:yes gene_type:complete